MRNYACTTQVPNVLFDEFLRELSFAELKVLLAVNRATWGWVIDKSGRRKERAWLTCSRMQTITGLSKRAITNAIAALVRRRLLHVADGAGHVLLDPHERRGQTKLFYSLAFPQDVIRRQRGSASDAEVDQHGMLIKETNKGTNQGTMSLDGLTTAVGSHHGHISNLLLGAVSPKLWNRLQASEKVPVVNRPG